MLDSYWLHKKQAGAGDRMLRCTFKKSKRRFKWDEYKLIQNKEKMILSELIFQLPIMRSICYCSAWRSSATNFMEIWFTSMLQWADQIEIYRTEWWFSDFLLVIKSMRTFSWDFTCEEFEYNISISYRLVHYAILNLIFPVFWIFLDNWQVSYDILLLSLKDD